MSEWQSYEIFDFRPRRMITLQRVIVALGFAAGVTFCSSTAKPKPLPELCYLVQGKVYCAKPTHK